MQTSKTPLEVAAAILTKRAQTRAELRRKLLKREEFTIDVVEEALAKLEEMGFLSDRRYTEDFVRIMRERSYGDRRIMEKLLFKGVDKDRQIILWRRSCMPMWATGILLMTPWLCWSGGRGNWIGWMIRRNGTSGSCVCLQGAASLRKSHTAQ